MGAKIIREKKSHPDFSLLFLLFSTPTQPPGTVVENEVFENERLQPFRGWGSDWPGHLLPTDRCGRFSARDGSPGGDAAAEFRRVARPLPRGGGWRWIEPDWRLDLSHIDVGSVDEEGWSYAFDFATCEWPPPPGSGRARPLRDFVRRRRWVRARMRLSPEEEEEEERARKEKLGAAIEAGPTAAAAAAAAAVALMAGGGASTPASAAEAAAQC